jgi:hypothetical protein
MTTMASNRPPKKPPPPDPQRSGKPVPKGKGRAKAPMPEVVPEVDNQANQTWQGVTFSDNETPVFESNDLRTRQKKRWHGRHLPSAKTFGEPLNKWNPFRKK